MVPTPRALALKGEIRQVVETMERLSTAAQSFDPASAQSTVVLVATGYLEHIFLGDVMKAVAARAAGVHVKMRLPDRLGDVSAMGRGEIDFLVGWMTAPPPILRSRLLFKDKLVCIARLEHPMLGEDGDLTYEKYVGLPHVQYDIPGKTTTERVLQERLSRDGHQQNIKYHVQNPLTVAHIVADSNLIATVPSRFAQRCLAQYPLHQFDLPFSFPAIQNRAYWHECMHSDEQNRWFRSLLVEIGKA
jgi:DNA-binding transcriptional LysR family regulator